MILLLKMNVVHSQPGLGKPLRPYHAERGMAAGSVRTYKATQHHRPATAGVKPVFLEGQQAALSSVATKSIARGGPQVNFLGLDARLIAQGITLPLQPIEVRRW
jgi:hypothetical protein